MIKIEDINKKNIQVDSIVDSNMHTLCNRINKAIGMMLLIDPELIFIITSGLRTPEQQSNLIKAGKSKATKSKHLIGAAIDIYDPDGKIKSILLSHPEILVACELWCEHFDSTPDWWHAQIIPPHSGNRWFYP